MDELPQELIDQILLNCDALTLSCLSRTSRSYALQVTHPSKAFIWKSLFLQTFDDPRPAMQINLHPRAGDEYDWMASLQKRFRAETIVGSAGGLKRVKLPEREELYETLLDIALTAAVFPSPPPLSPSGSSSPSPSSSSYHPPTSPIALPPIPSPDDDESIELGGGGGDKIPTGKNIIWLIKLTEPYGQLIFHHQLWTPSPREVQLRSHLHVLIGLTKIDHTPDMRLNSRSYVYDISHYTPGALYGPFLDPDAPTPSAGGDNAGAAAGASAADPSSTAELSTATSSHAGPSASDTGIDEIESLNASSTLPVDSTDEDPEIDYEESPLTAVPINRPPSLDSDPHNHKILTNWLHLRHIHHVFTLNFIDRVTIPTSPITRPLALPFIQANSASGLRGRREDDWAGIEGRWQVGFSFCDHRDLIRMSSSLLSTET